jgi:hypothetical protein
MFSLNWSTPAGNATGFMRLAKPMKPASPSRTVGLSSGTN